MKATRGKVVISSMANDITKGIEPGYERSARMSQFIVTYVLLFLSVFVMLMLTENV